MVADPFAHKEVQTPEIQTTKGYLIVCGYMSTVFLVGVPVNYTKGNPQIKRDTQRCMGKPPFLGNQPLECRSFTVRLVIDELHELDVS